ncbi:oxygenase MpaB family protein [Kitasatospora sp. NPDC098663]|uniref:oxygenase MpaB family protein n=1 Tax=Kitasatospora sp. NPDC098663 TaxID=3364096 RepID=UPI0037FBC2D9
MSGAGSAAGRPRGLADPGAFGPSSGRRAGGAIAGVRRVHPRVTGTAPDGRRYRADDPELLRWVHIAEVYCFLTGYQAFAAAPLSAAECDRYLAEAACVAERLGARAVPRSRAEVAAYLAGIRPHLRATPPALDVLRLLRGFGRSRRERAAVRVLTNASTGLLPSWPRGEIAVRRPSLVRAAWDRRWRGPVAGSWSGPAVPRRSVPRPTPRPPPRPGRQGPDAPRRPTSGVRAPRRARAPGTSTDLGAARAIQPALTALFLTRACLRESGTGAALPG